MAVASHRIQEAFERTKREFRGALRNPAIYADIQKATCIEDIYDAVEKLQEEQGKRGHLRHLRRIDPYLERVRQYSEVINTFVQAKSEILSLIWGPIALLLQIAKNLTKSFDAVISIMATIGESLPLFGAYTQLFSSSERILDVLCLFYKDILDFYSTALNFFSAKRWELLFDSVWPRHKAKIELVATNIERHGLLMSNEVSLEHIAEAHSLRLAAFEHYERTREFQERQDYEMVETYIRPRLYDSELDMLHRTRFKGTGRWLQTEKTLCDWLDNVDPAARLVWLQGIPGAGKTYLSAGIVERARNLSPNGTIYAFLSYKESSSTTAISILHSLIFQLVSEDKYLQIILWDAFQSNRRDLKSNTKFAQETLSILLKCASRTYIIIDGLDEISELERQMTLHILTGILEDCDETSLLISSRLEDDIGSILKDSVQPIRVDHRNSGCLQAYITGSAEKWLREANFDSNSRSEIKALLAPLAAKARGMFLYVRIVMDSVKTCHNIDSVRSELRILPESLEEAYERVLKRVNTLPPTLRERAVRILGWIGCSPVPITVQEVEQAICIKPGRLDYLPQVQGSLNITQLCGPIVEAFGDHLHFVHFTVKEYLCGRRNDNVVDVKQATVDLTTTCLTYLCLDIFDPEIEENYLDEQILSGGYRLHTFAASQWVALLRSCARMLRDQTPPDELISLLEHFVTERENMGYTNPSENIAEDPDFKSLKQRSPQLHAMLCHASKFRQLDVGEWRLDEDTSWTDFDPSTLSQSSVQIYEQFEAMLCPGSGHATDCNCSRLKSHYGSRLFGCAYTVCHSQQIAFEIRLDRNSHTKRHDRPFKCRVSTCAYASIGFQSKSQFQKHWLRCHQDPTPTPSRPSDDPDDDEIQPLLFDLIRLGKVDEVTRLMPRFFKLDIFLQGELRKLAAFTGSLEMAQIVIQSASWEIITEAIRGENIDVLKWAATRYPGGEQPHLVAAIHSAALRSTTTEVFQIWEKNFSKLNRTGEYHILHYVVIQAVTDPMPELRLSKLWKELFLLGELPRTTLNTALRTVAVTTCSPLLAKTLLECGADPDFKQVRRRATKTPIHLAAIRTSRAAAELMKVLLLFGADPTITIMTRGHGEIRTPAMERGARNISKWLGMTWDELVDWAAEQRKEKLRKDSESLVSA